MKLLFFEPPPSQRAGGLDRAIRSLEHFLRTSGVTVHCNPSKEMFERADDSKLVHFHGLWQPNFPRVSAKCRRLRIPYVVSPHGMVEPWAWRHKWWKKRIYFQLVERRHVAGAARLVATSETEASNLKQFFPGSRCDVLPLGIAEARGPGYEDARRTLGWKSSELVLLFLSRIHPKKGLDLLIKSLAYLKEVARDRDARLVIVGDGDDSYVGRLRRLAAKKLGTNLPVTWTGGIWDDRKWAYLQGADLMCLPSHSENFGLVILEALQVGTPVLTTDQTPWSALPGLGGGWIVRPDVEPLTEALAEFFKGPRWTTEQRTRLAADVQSQFSWEKVGPAYIRFYEDILRDARQDGRDRTWNTTGKT